MELVAVTECNQELIKKLEIFEQEINYKLPFVDKIKQIKNKSNKDKNCSVELLDLIYCQKNSKITNICYLNGNSDNKLVQLEILNLNKSHIKTNINFVEAATNYAFSVLNAETVTIFSNDFSDEDLQGIGYESLGKYKDKNTFVKDREKQIQLGASKK